MRVGVVVVLVVLVLMLMFVAVWESIEFSESSVLLLFGGGAMRQLLVLAVLVVVAVENEGASVLFVIGEWQPRRFMVAAAGGP